MHGRTRWMALLCLLMTGLFVWWLLGDPSGSGTLIASGDGASRVAPDAPTLEAAGRTRPAHEETLTPGTSEDAPPSPAAEGGMRIRGTIRRVDGEPAPRCDAHLLRKGVAAADRGKPENLIPLPIDGTGRFDRTVAVDDLSKFWLCVVPRSDGGVLPAFVDGADIRSGEELLITLELGRKLLIEVFDASGRPLDGVQISLSPLDLAGIAAWAEPGEPTMGSWSHPTGPTSNRRAYTLPYAGPLRVDARKRGYARGTRIVDPATEMVVFHLVVPRSTIRVVLENSAEWPRATARLLVDDPRYVKWPPQLQRAAFTDGVATFKNDVGPGLYQVKVGAWDSTQPIVRGIRITETLREREVRVRLERREGFGRLLVEWDRRGPTNPRVWIRRPGKDWERWFMIFTREEGLELRLLPAGAVDLALALPDGSAASVVPGARIESRRDARLAPPFLPIHEFTLRVAQPDKWSGPIAAAWIVTEDGSRIPPLAHARAGIKLAPMLIKPGLVFQPHLVFQVPSRTAVLHWEGSDGTQGRAELTRVE